MRIETIIDLEENNWYYDGSNNKIFKVLQNNSCIVNGSVSGYLIVKHIQQKPCKVQSSELSLLIESDNLEVITESHDLILSNPNENQTAKQSSNS